MRRILLVVERSLTFLLRFANEKARKRTKAFVCLSVFPHPPLALTQTRTLSPTLRKP